MPSSKNSSTRHRVQATSASVASGVWASALEMSYLNSGSSPNERRISSQAGGPGFTVVEGDTDTVLASSDVALTASGTATVQAALHDTPMVVVYRMAPLSFQLARRVVKVEAIGMVNLIAGEKIVPELVQEAFTAEAVAREAIDILTDPARAARIREGLASVRAKLGGSGASRRAAEAILRVVRSSHQSPVVSGQS